MALTSRKPTWTSILIPTGETQQFANSTVGFRRLIAWLRERPVSRVVYEPTGPWHRDFERALGKAGLPLSRVNPLQARRFAQALGQKAKTDAIDARILAAMGRVLDLPRSRPSSQWQTELRELHTARQALIKDRTATLNRQKQARVPCSSANAQAVCGISSANSKPLRPRWQSTSRPILRKRGRSRY